MVKEHKCIFESGPSRVGVLLGDLYLSCWGSRKVEAHLFFRAHTIALKVWVTYFADVSVYFKFAYARFLFHFANKGLNVSFSFFLMSLREPPKASSVSKQQKLCDSMFWLELYNSANWLLQCHFAYAFFKTVADNNSLFLFKRINIDLRTEQ